MTTSQRRINTDLKNKKKPIPNLHTDIFLIQGSQGCWLHSHLLMILVYPHTPYLVTAWTRCGQPSSCVVVTWNWAIYNKHLILYLVLYHLNQFGTLCDLWHAGQIHHNSLAPWLWHIWNFHPICLELTMTSAQPCFIDRWHSSYSSFQICWH
jgi:hypothetical protein